MAAGKLTIPQIAKKAGVSQRTVSLWKNDKDFQAEVKRIKNAWRAEVRGKGAADQEERLRGRNDRYARLRAVIEQRAKDPRMKDVPGGKTGLLTVTYKMQSMGEGRGSAAVPEYAVDTGLLTAMLEIEEHNAIEKGEWKLKTVADTNVNVALTIVERLHAGRERLAKAKRDAATQAA